MINLFAALAVFLLAHSIPALSPVRARLIGTLGRRTYLILYSLLSIVLLGWVLHAAMTVDYIPLWDARPWMAHVTMALSPIGLFLILAGLVSPNPMSISFRAGDAPGAIVGLTRHPVLWGFILWSGSHMLANGDLRALVLFGGLALFAVGGIAINEKRARRRLGPAWDSLSAQSAVLPLAAWITGRARPRVDLAMAGAALVAILISAWLIYGGHAMLFGADPLALARA